ncbi:uncharacterized protein LOC126893676 isoform X2 [Daktulosphaira vitifoliae]|uniref:uncharacterized protein LOC126893676 isoform X2 n=1 Tax=Daktulosphaira vitifoliae TaxID=58002 RepID=UPI0021AA1560|nr:uncharacterized protein LOC126893676 isoform X2 [Daktulosphaira vitifoliae]
MEFFNWWIVLFIKLVFSQYTSIFRPNLPSGEYKTKIYAFLPCNYTNDYLLQFNYYISKTSPSKYMLMGNITFLIIFDDSLFVNVNYAMKGSNGGWIDNAHIMSSNNACSSFKTFFGNNWLEFAKAFQFNVIDCPIKPGIYKSIGYDTSKLTVHSKVLGCFSLLQDVLRPWE